MKGASSCEPSIQLDVDADSTDHVYGAKAVLSRHWKSGESYPKANDAGMPSNGSVFNDRSVIRPVRAIADLLNPNRPVKMKAMVSLILDNAPDANFALETGTDGIAAT